MEDTSLCDKTKSVNIDPFPENNIFICCGGFHFTFHLNVENL